MTKIWLIPLIIYLAIVPFTPHLDISISNLFYDHGFIYKNHSFFEAMRIYGEKPAFITGGIALAIFLISFFSKHMRPYRESCLFIVLTLIVGAGLITNVLLKDHWGRPRPRQIVEFGGISPFRPMYEPDFHNPAGKSFCSGHASMGFFFFALMIAGWRRRNSPLIYLGLFLTLFMGISLSITRIAQGAHFFSDVMTSAMVMWLSALLINWLVPERESTPDTLGKIRDGFSNAKTQRRKDAEENKKNNLSSTLLLNYLFPLCVFPSLRLCVKKTIGDFCFRDLVCLD